MSIPNKRAAFAILIRIRRLSQLSVLAIFAWMVAGCNAYLHFGITATTAPSPTTTASDASSPEAMVIVTFKVQIPADTPPEDELVLSLLDEVTGLTLNVQRHAMQKIDDLHYEVNLPFSVGSVVKYRYGRQGSFLVEEHTSKKIPVRYRLYRVDGPGMVEDIVSTWSDTNYSGPSGRIMGSVNDSTTSRPVPNLLVTAGGSQTITASDGSFLIEALPAGIHTLVVYAMDGAYRTFQQGAKVAPDSSTLPAIQVIAAPQIPITFELKVPEDTLSAIPLRLAGNLSQLGNTFADLTGGTNTIASRMPVLSRESDGLYRLTINLPAGAYLEYKYTLGDGFVNAEYNEEGNLRLRHLIIPETPVTLQDQVATWGTEFNPGPVIFDVTVPGTTPQNDRVSIQFNPYDWSEPVTMWRLDDLRWVFISYNPVQSGSVLTYRYCRNDQCGNADDNLTPGAQNSGRFVEVEDERQTIQDTVDSWIWLADQEQIPLRTTQVNPRAQAFTAGVEFQPDYHPSWISQLPNTLTDIQSLQSNWLFVSPSWTFTNSSPVVLEAVSGIDPTWDDTNETIAQAQSRGLQVAVFPTPHFNDSASKWWKSASRDYAWWLVWFERYRTFILHHADLAQVSGAQALILGGDWINPALPGGLLADGTPSNVLADAEARWEGLIAEVREHFTGELIWAIPASPDILATYPTFISSLDKIYLLWSLGLAAEDSAGFEQLTQAALNYLDNQVQPFKAEINKPILLGLSYPSATGSIYGCVPDPVTAEASGCLDVERLSRPEPDIPEVTLSLEEQYLAYEAVIEAINLREWINGVVSRGYYPPVALQDKSISIHGKPVEDLLEYWFPKWVNSSVIE